MTQMTHNPNTHNDQPRSKPRKKNVKQIRTLRQLKNMKGFKICHLNVRSIRSKLDELKILTEQASPHLFIITESWLSPVIPDSFIAIDKYQLHRKDRTWKKGGGILLLVDKSYAHTITPIISNTETMQLVINFTNQHAVTIIASYRPPDTNPTEYLEDLSNIIRNVKTKELILIGDLNFDYNDNASKPLKRMTEKLGLHQLINEPTRICHTRSSTLDLIFTNQSTKYSKA